MSCSRDSVVPSQRSFPQASVQDRQPGQSPGGRVDSISHMPDWDFVFRPARNRGRKGAGLPSRAGGLHHSPTRSADRQIGHVKRLRRVIRVLAAQSQQVMERNAELLLGVSTEVLLDESRSEAVKTGGHRRVRGEEIADSSRGQCHFEGLAVCSIKLRARSRTANAACPSFRWQTSGWSPRARSSRHPPIPSSISCLRRNSGPPHRARW